jgi:hypothetical protein
MSEIQSKSSDKTNHAPELQVGAIAKPQANKVKSVKWASHAVQTNTLWTADDGLADVALSITLNGTLAVTIAATALFATFVLSGITFSLVNPGGAGTTSFNFTYTGTQSAAYIQGLFATGANITFS